MSLVRIHWPPQPSPPPLRDDEVHVWTASLDHEPERFAALRELLVDEDHERADRYRIPVIRSQFVAARAFLRSVLGAYTAVDPRKVTFHYGPQGKPYLLHPNRPLFFNLSHSHSLALVAVSKRVEIGVDVEQVRQFNDLAFAERYFTPREVSTLMAVPEHQRTEVFFHAWTRKEAFLKATGEGIAIGLDRVEVSLAPMDPAHLVLVDGCPRQAAEWALSHLAPAAGYVGALALRHRGMQVRCWQWPVEALVVPELQSA
jgi:4'-phosphopantetheinyl transferase